MNNRSNVHIEHEDVIILRKYRIVTNGKNSHPCENKINQNRRMILRRKLTKSMLIVQTVQTKWKMPLRTQQVLRMQQ